MKFFIPFMGSLLLLFGSGCKSKSSAYLFGLGDGPAATYSDSLQYIEFGPHIILPVTIGQKSYRFLFDTGAMMLLTPELAQTLNAKVVKQNRVTDSQGRKEKLPYVHLDSLSINNKLFYNLTAAVADLNLAPALGCMKIDGILGANLMRMAIWRIDYQKKMIYFTNSFDDFVPDTNALVLPFYQKVTGTPKISLTIGGETVNHITFDTGSSGTLGMPKSSLPKLAAQKGVTSYGYHSQGLYGAVADTNYYYQPTLTIDSTEVPIAAVELSSGKGSKLLGQSFLENYRVTINWQTEKIYLTPVSIPKEARHYSITPFFENEKIYVGTVVMGSDAYALGIRVGDEIVAINNIDLRNPTHADYCALRDIWQGDAAEIEVTVAGKERIILTKTEIFR